MRPIIFISNAKNLLNSLGAAIVTYNAVVEVDFSEAVSATEIKTWKIKI